MPVTDQDLQRVVEAIDHLNATLKDLMSALQVSDFERPSVHTGVLDSSKKPSLTVRPAVDEADASLRKSKVSAKTKKPEPKSAMDPELQNSLNAVNKQDLFLIAKELGLQVPKKLTKPDLVSVIGNEGAEKLEAVLVNIQPPDKVEDPKPKTTKSTTQKQKKAESRNWTASIFKEWPKYALIELGMQLGVTHLFRISKKALIDKMLQESDEHIDLAYKTHWQEVKEVESTADAQVWEASDFEEFSREDLGSMASYLNIETRKKPRQRLIKQILETGTDRINQGFELLWPALNSNAATATTSNHAANRTKPTKPESKTKLEPDDSDIRRDLENLDRAFLVDVSKELKLKTSRQTKKDLVKNILACSIDEITKAFNQVTPNATG